MEIFLLVLTIFLMALDSKEIPLGGTETAFGLFFDVLKQARLGLLSIIPDKRTLAVWKKKPTRTR